MFLMLFQTAKEPFPRWRHLTRENSNNIPFKNTMSMQDYYKTNIQNDNDLRKKSFNL